MKNIKRSIKFSGKKCVMRPLPNEEGLIETWEATELNDCKEYFNYKGQKYKLISSKESK